MSTLRELGKGGRAVLGFIVGAFGASILLAIIYGDMKTGPCQLLPVATCHKLDGHDYVTLGEFLSSVPASFSFAAGAAFGGIGGWISG